MTKKLPLTPMRDYPPTLKAGIIYLCSLLAIFLLLDIFSSKILIEIPVNVQEIGEAGVGYSFTFQLKSLMKILLLSVVHGSISYLVFRNLIQQRVDQANSLNERMSSFQIQSLHLILVLIMATFMMGHVIHWIADRANFLLVHEAGEYPVNEGFLLVYYADEYLSHAIIHVSYFLLFVLGVYCELGIKPRRKLNSDEMVIVAGLVIGVVILNGEAARGGESALILLILSGCAVVFLSFYFLIKKITLREYPLCCTLLFGSLGVVIYDIVWWIIAGIPYYPYIT